MKKTVKVGMLTGLILAPAAAVSANETDVVIDGEQLDPIVTEDTSTVADPYSAVADLSFDLEVVKSRLNELFNLNENTTVADFENYRTMVDMYLADGKDAAGNTVSYASNRQILAAKIDFLEKLKDLSSRAKSLTSEAALLKDTNPNLFETVPLLDARYKELEANFTEIRKELDDVINDTTGYTPLNTNLGFDNSDFERLALGGLDNYLVNADEFVSKFIGATTVTALTNYVEDIKKPHAFIYGGTIQELDNQGNLQTTPLTNCVEDIAVQDVILAGDEAAFRASYEYLTKFYTEKLNAKEKKIADAHVLADGRTVAAVLKSAQDDIAKADKVSVLIDEIAVMNEKDFKKKVENIVKEYDKLNPRQKALVTEYDTVILGTDGTDGYKDALDVYNAIEDLKKRDSSEEYRKAVKETKVSYDLLKSNLQRFITNVDTLDVVIADLKVAVGYDAVADAPVTPETSPEQLIAMIASAADIKAAREAYDALTKEQQKLVGNYKELQTWEKSGKTTIKVEDQIDSIVIENKKTFVTKTDSVNKAYDKLTAEEKKLVTNYDRLQYLTPFAAVTGSFYNLKTTANTYKTDVASLLSILNGTTGNLADALNNANNEDKVALEKLQKELTTSVEKLQAQLDNADKVIDSIKTANGTFTNNNDQLLAIQAAREAYNALPKEEQKLVTNLKTLTELEKVIKQPADVTKKIEAVDPENISKFPSTAKTAVTAFDKLTTTQKSYISPENIARVEDFKVFLAFVDQIKALKPSAAGFQEAYAKAKEEFDRLKIADVWKSNDKEPEYAKAIAEAVKTYETTLTTHNDSITNGNALVDRIDKLGMLTGQMFLNEAEAIEAAYAALSADGKKQVTNYKQFQALKKDGTAALKVVDLINDPVIRGVNVANSGYAKKVESAVKAYEKLTSRQKSYVYNYDSGLKPYLKVYEIVAAINNLNPSAKTYIEDVAAIRLQYDRLSKVDQNYLAPILHKIEGAETGLVTVNEVMDMIDAARPGVEDYVQKLVAARQAYDNLARINSSYQKLVLNYKTLQEREKALKPVTTAIHQIEELKEMIARPFNDATDFIKKYNDAVKSYEKIPYESRELVYNREVLLSTIYPVAKTMEAIANIKSSSKTFGEDVKKARDLYNSLSNSDKALVTNYKDLVAFENTVSGGTAVDELIRAIPSKSPTEYMQAIKDARAAYDALTAAEKKAVALYKELQNYEKGVKNVQATIDAIDNLQYASNLVSAYDKAVKALDKLTADQRQMVPNMDKLQNVAPAIEVYKMINALKPSSANYTGSVQAAYAAYNMLSSSEKQYVTNFAELQEAKNNIDKVQEVISKISSISPSSRDYSKQVEEALALYNSLPSAVRKLVTNYDVLQASQKESSAVDKVRSLISEINPNASNFESKVKSARSAYDKLTTQQKRLVTNYYMLEDYESQLEDNSFFFF